MNLRAFAFLLIGAFLFGTIAAVFSSIDSSAGSGQSHPGAEICDVNFCVNGSNSNVTIGAFIAPGRFTITTTNSSTTARLLFNIHPNGSVIIGNSTPWTIFHIGGGSLKLGNDPPVTHIYPKITEYTATGDSTTDTTDLSVHQVCFLAGYSTYDDANGGGPEMCNVYPCGSNWCVDARGAGNIIACYARCLDWV